MQLINPKKSNITINGHFLETSVQIKRLLGHPDHQRIIEKQLENSNKLTSYFVFREFKQAVLLPLIEFYFVLKEENCLKDAVLAFGDTSQKIRDIKEVMALLSELVEMDDLKNDKNKALSYIQTHILLLFSLFKESVDGYVTDLTSFENSKSEINNGEEGFLQFQKDMKCVGKCGQVKFWKLHKKHLVPLTNTENVKLYKAYDGFIDKQNLFNEIKADINRSDMITRCQGLGDVIISIECPKNLRLITLDKAFFAYCAILKKKYAIVPSLVGLRKGETIQSN